MASISDVRHMISRVIDELGGDSYEARVNKDTWTVSRGSVSGSIMLFEDKEDSDDSTVLVTFEVMKVPLPKSLPFFRRLLELNYSLNGRAAFAVDDENIVHIQYGRTVLDLDDSELEELILRTATAADVYDDILLGEFGYEYALD